MIPPYVIAFALALPVRAAPRYTLELGARTELRLREADAARALVWDTEERAEARCVASFRRGEAWLGYSPRLVLDDVTGDRVISVLHGGELGLRWAFRRLSLTAAERVSYGTRSTSSLLPSGPSLPADVAEPGGSPDVPPAELQPVPAPESVAFVSSDTSLGARFTLSLRSSLRLDARYFVGGGADAASRATVPYTAVAQTTLGWDHAATRRDTLSTSGGALAQSTQTDVDTVRAYVMNVSETWRRIWSRRANSELGVGVAVLPDQASDGASGAYPTARSTVSYDLPSGPGHARVGIAAQAVIDVVVDSLSGLPDQRAALTLRGTWTPRPLSLFGEVGHSWSVQSDDPNAIRATSAAAGIEYELERWMSLESGLRVVDQSLQSPTAPSAGASGLRWVAFVAVQLTAEAIALE